MGVSAALLFDLAEEECFEIEKERLKLKKVNTQLGKVHQFTLDELAKKKKPQKLSSVIISIANKSRKRYDELITSYLKEVQVGIEERKFLFIRYKKYYLIHARERQALCERLSKCLVRDNIVDQALLPLLILIHTVQMTRIFSEDRKERKRIHRLLEQLTKENDISTGIKTAIQSIQTAIVASTISASVAASAAR